MIEGEEQQQQQPPSDPEPRPVVGYIECPYCAKDENAQAAQVRKNVKGKLYFVCPVHSIQLMNSKASQEWILANMRDKAERPNLRESKSEPAPTPKKGGNNFLKAIKDW